MGYGIVSVQTTTQATSNVYLADVTDAAATAASKQVSLKWSDPDHVELNGASLARWAGTLVVRKAGSAPADKDDGTVILTNTVKDQYKTTAYVDSGLTNGTTYYYRFFPFSKDNVYTDGAVVSARPSAESLTIPTVTGTYTYNTREQTPTVDDFVSTKMTKSGDTSGTNAGSYSMVFSLNSDDYIWSDGTYTDKTVNWSINQADGGVSLNKSTVALDTKNTSTTVTINQTGDGELSVDNSAPTIASGVISGTTLTISRVGTNVGTTTITVKAAASTNYKAAQAQVVVTTSNYKIMTVKIDEANSNPETCCTYADDALDMEVGSAEWDEFFGYYPVLFKDGAEVVKLDPNNYAQDINGNTVDITSGDSGDVMVAFPRRGLKMSKSGDIVTISMTDAPNDPDFKYYAHQRGETEKDKFYIGAYKGYSKSSKLRSISGVTPTVNQKIGAFRTLAQANGKSDGNGGGGYEIGGFFQLTYCQAMYCLKYKNLNCQVAVGQGYVGGSSATKTGNTNTQGLNYGTTSNTVQCKLFGVEDMWGNIWEWIDGVVTDSSRNALTATDNFNDAGTGYTNQGATAASDLSNYPWRTKICGTSEKGFISTAAGGSATTYYCDIGDVVAEQEVARAADGVVHHLLEAHCGSDIVLLEVIGKCRGVVGVQRPPQSVAARGDAVAMLVHRIAPCPRAPRLVELVLVEGVEEIEYCRGVVAIVQRRDGASHRLDAFVDVGDARNDFGHIGDGLLDAQSLGLLLLGLALEYGRDDTLPHAQHGPDDGSPAAAYLRSGGGITARRADGVGDALEGIGHLLQLGVARGLRELAHGTGDAVGDIRHLGEAADDVVHAALHLLLGLAREGFGESLFQCIALAHVAKLVAYLADFPLQPLKLLGGEVGVVGEVEVVETHVFHLVERGLGRFDILHGLLVEHLSNIVLDELLLDVFDGLRVLPLHLL